MSSASGGVVRAVFDCMVYLQAAGNADGPAGACWSAVRDGRVAAFIGTDAFAELVEVAGRPKVARKLHTTSDRLLRFVDEVERLAVRLDAVPPAFAHPSDPKDDPIINLAIAADAHVITSRDHHLLELRDPSTPAGRAFLARFAAIDVLTPDALLDRLRASESP